MHAVAWGALRSARRPHLWRAARIIAGVRRHAPSRTFHNSRGLCNIPDASNPAPALPGDNDGKATDNAEEVKDIDDITPEDKDVITKDAEKVTPSRAAQRREMAARRANRGVKVKEVPPVILPESFDQNIRWAGPHLSKMRVLKSHAWEGDYTGPLASTEFAAEGKFLGKAPNHAREVDESLEGTRGPNQVDFKVEKQEDGTGKLTMVTAPNDENTPNPYLVEREVFYDVLENISGALAQRPPPGVEPKDLLRPDIVLQCPKRNANIWLNELVDTTAQAANADVVRLSPDDIAEIVGKYMGENLAWTYSSYSLLGYEAHKVSQVEDEMRKGEEDEEDLDPEADEASGPGSDDMKAFTTALRAGSKLSALAVSDGGRSSNVMSFDELFGQGPNSRPTSSVSSSDSWSNFKLTAVLEALVDASWNRRFAADFKPPTAQAGAEEAFKGAEPESKEHAQSKRVILHITQYREMSKTPVGIRVLKMLRDIVKKRWLEGRSIALVGTTTAGDIVEASKSSPGEILDAVVHTQSDVVFGDCRTIVVTPAKAPLIRSFEDDEADRIRNINIRHIKDMVVNMAPTEAATQTIIDQIDGTIAECSKDRDLPLEERKQMAPIKSAGVRFFDELGESVWPYAHVHRLAASVIGSSSLHLDEPLPAILLSYAKIRWGDEHKAKFLKEQATGKPLPATAFEKTTNASAEGINDPDYPTDKLSEETAAKLKAIKAKCSKREAKLLGGVSDTSKLKATFEDVRCPPETIEALKTLTSLSLSRPDAFSYGVLSKDKIPGVLLYGPPGTGKTLLAKALAKESGVTVLEVSASEIYDKYVGEGEKNVRAVFSLAKKLSPCIVFIDEADSLFAERDGRERASHREIINQFLREWDGMAGNDAFIMIATNRPFDIDEAILRRLPRRLLVDLPVEEDRKAILDIHLKGEELEENVSLEKIAKNTPFYSGSDLKNVSVAAALACVREEIANAVKAADAAGISKAEQRIKGKLVFPAKRILAERHFDTALQEISASISEDMQSLKNIRKFDEKYGDRKGRTKKKAGMGFGREREKVDESEALIRKRDPAKTDIKKDE